MSYFDKESNQILFEVGDTIDFEFQTFPGPDDHKIKAKVIKCLSPMFYEIRYKFQGKFETRQIMRGHLPDPKEVTPKKKLKPQHQIVVNEIAKGKTQTEAYQTAYPNTEYFVAAAAATRLLKNVKISDAIQERINRAISHNNVTPEEVIGSAAFNMRSSMDDLIDEKGYFDLKKARQTGAIDLIKEMEITESVDLETMTKSVKHKIKYESSAAARKELANYLKIENAPKQNLSDITDDQLARELYARLTSKYQYSHDDALMGVRLEFPGVEISEINVIDVEPEN